MTGKEYKTQWYNSSNFKIEEKANSFSPVTTSSNYDFANIWGGNGEGTGLVKTNWGIAVASDGSVYVTDYNSGSNHRVLKYDAHGNYISSFGSWGTGNGYFKNPHGIAIDSSGNIYVVDTDNNRVQKFNSSGSYVTQWGSSGSGNGQFNSPCGITVDNSGSTYIADNGNKRIQEFNSSRNYVTQWPDNYPQAIFLSGNSLYTNYYKSSEQITPIVEYLKDWTIQLTQVDDTVNNSTSGSKTSRIRYTYDSNYGNVVTEYHDGDTSTANDDSTVWRLYYPNTSANILDKPARVRIYATAMASDSGGSNLKQETDNYYDSNNSSLSTPPTHGNLTRLQQYKDSSNSVSTYYTYDGNGNQLTAQDPNGNTTTTTYDSTYHSYPYTKSYAIAGLSESYSYNAGTNNLLSQTDLNGITTSYEYDTFKRLIKVIKTGDSSGSPSIQYQYNSWGTINSQNITTITKIDADHSLWQIDYFDGLGRIVQTQNQGETSHAIISKTTAYNNRGLVDKQYVSQDVTPVPSAYVTPGGSWKYLTYIYDALSRVATQTNADGTSISNDYSTAWQNTVTNERDYQNTYIYDAFSRLTQVQNFSTATSPVKYESYDGQSDSTGLGTDYIAQTFTPSVSHTITSFKMKLVRSGSVSGTITGYLRATTSSHPTGNGTDLATSSGVDESNIPTSYSDITFSFINSYALTSGTTYSLIVHATNSGLSAKLHSGGGYSGGGVCVSGDGNNWNMSHYSDDFWFEEWGTTGAAPITTSYSYDILGNLTQVVDDSHNTTSISYDWLSSKTGMTDPDMGSWSYEYDNNGNLTHQTDAKNQTIILAYDNLNRLTGKTYPAGSGMTNVSYAFDSTSGGNYGKGKRTGMSDAMSDANHPSTFQFDSRGRLIQETRWEYSNNNWNSYTTGYSYDDADRINTITYPTGEVVTQTYNDRGLVNTLSGNTAGSLITSTLYNALGSITEINLNNGIKTSYGYYGTGGTYDTSGGYYGRLWEIKSVKTGNSPIQDVQHSWDEAGNLSQRQDLVSSETENFTYDYLDRLTAVSGAYSQSIAYNNLGNITANNGDSYSYGSKPHAVTQVGSTSYNYDANGNMLTRGSQALSWDTENRPSSVSTSITKYENYNATNDNTNLGTGYMAQTFTPQANHTLTSFKMKIYNGGATGKVTGSLRATDGSGVPTSADLVVSQSIDENTMPAAWTETTFYFNNGYALSSGTKYALIIHSNSSGLSLRLDVSGGYSYGQYGGSGDGSSWNMSNTTYDLWFEEYGVTSTIASFIYDGDGNRVKKTESGCTILYVNKYYEKNITSGIVTTYYYLGGKLIANRQDTTLNYILQEHLGSSSVVADTNGASTATIRYFPFGSTRSSSGTLPTDMKFTGQRLDGTGLYYFNARYYDASNDRFVNADIHIQDFTNPQTLNRYSYALNNPLRYTDPTGWWTFGIGFNLNFGAGAGGSGSVMLVFDGHGGIGIAYSGGGGGYGGVGASLTVQGQYTSADRIQDLRGFQVQTGGSVSVGSGFVSATGGAEWVAAKNYQGVNVQLGASVSPIPAPVMPEMHSNLEYGGVTTLRDTQPDTNSSHSDSQLPATSAPVTIVAPAPTIPNMVAQSTSSEFSASSTQLNQLISSGVSVDSTSYQQAIDTAFNTVVSNLGVGQMVGWSNESGYYAVNITSCSYYDYW